MAAALATTAEREMSQQLPAPKTFAPSREDVLSSLAFFFGDPAVPEKLRDYSEHHAMCVAFPLRAIHCCLLAHPARLRPQDLPLPGRVLRSEHVSANIKLRSPPQAASREQ